MVCSADAEIHQGALAPYALRYTVTSSDVSFDLSTVSAAVFRVKREGGNPDSWTASLENQSATSIDIVRVFLATDVPNLEVLTVTPVLTTPSGDFVATPRKLRVKSLFE